MSTRLSIVFIFIGTVLATGFFSSCKSKEETEVTAAEKKLTYTCPMHPQIISEKPGTCPVCGMDLVPFDKTNVSDNLTLNESQRALANVTTDTIKEGSFSSFKQLNGRLVVNPGQTEFVSSRVAGRLENLFVKETGVPVRKGQTLYTIYSEQLAALQQEYLIALAQVAAFPNDDKFRQLADGARQKLLLYGQTEGQLQQLRNKKQTSPFISYASPVDGVVAEMFVTEGQYVGEGSAILRVEGYNNIWVEADIYPAEASLVKKGDRVNVSIAGSNLDQQTMRVEFIAPALQTGSQLLTIRGSIPNPGNQLKAGMPALVEIPVSNTSRAITLPVDAIIRDQNGAHVWKEISEGKFAPAMVETGADNFNRVEIVKGVSVGDVVVTSGAYLLYSEFVLKKGKDPMAGHNH